MAGRGSGRVVSTSTPPGCFVMRGIKIKDGILFCRGKEVFRKDPAFILIPPTKLLSSKIDRSIYINLDDEFDMDFDNSIFQTSGWSVTTVPVPVTVGILRCRKLATGPCGYRDRNDEVRKSQGGR